jgi:hypothetical protein
MGNRQHKRVRKAVRLLTGDRFRELIAAMLDAPLGTRLRYAVIIVFRLGRNGLKEKP